MRPDRFAVGPRQFKIRGELLERTRCGCSHMYHGTPASRRSEAGRAGQRLGRAAEISRAQGSTRRLLDGPGVPAQRRLLTPRTGRVVRWRRQSGALVRMRIREDCAAFRSLACASCGRCRLPRRAAGAAGHPGDALAAPWDVANATAPPQSAEEESRLAEGDPGGECANMRARCARGASRTALTGRSTGSGGTSNDQRASVAPFAAKPWR